MQCLATADLVRGNREISLHLVAERSLYIRSRGKFFRFKIILIAAAVSDALIEIG
jgi:hypothetical protein